MNIFPDTLLTEEEMKTVKLVVSNPAFIKYVTAMASRTVQEMTDQVRILEDSVLYQKKNAYYHGVLNCVESILLAVPEAPQPPSNTN